MALLAYHMVAPDYRLVSVLMQHWRLLAMIPALLIMDDLMNKRKESLQKTKNLRRLQLKKDKAAQDHITEKQSLTDITDAPVIYNNIRPSY